MQIGKNRSIRILLMLECAEFESLKTRWLGERLELIGGVIILFTSLFTVIQNDTISPGTAGLCISYALTVTNLLNMTVRSFTDLETR